MPIGWNALYAVMEFDETKTTYELRNVCVPQEFQLANDELCEGWEQWEVRYSIYWNKSRLKLI